MKHLSLQQKIDSKISLDIFDQTKKSLGFIPNMYQKMGHNPALLDAYIYAYNSFRSNSGFNSVEQEVVFLSVAFENNCEYCMAAHSFIGDNMTNVPKEITNAIRENKKIPDTKLAALSKLTRLLVINRGKASDNEIKGFIAVGYSESHILAIIAGIAIKTMSNYSNHLTNPEVDSTFSGRSWSK